MSDSGPGGEDECPVVCSITLTVPEDPVTNHALRPHVFQGGARVVDEATLLHGCRVAPVVDALVELLHSGQGGVSSAPCVAKQI